MADIENDKSDNKKDTGMIIFAAVVAKIKVYMYLFNEFAMAAIIILFMVFVVFPIIGLLMWHGVGTVRIPDPDDMTEDCREIYDMFKANSYEGTEIWWVSTHEDGGDEYIAIDFDGIPRNPAVIKQVIDDLTIYYDESCPAGNLEKCRITFDEVGYDSGDYPISARNYVDERDEYHPEWQKYANGTYGKWWIYRPFVNDWKDLEENLSFSEGLYCLIYDCSDISEADSEAWPNLKYIRLEYYGEDADVYEQELKELFPNAEVHVGEY